MTTLVPPLVQSRIAAYRAREHEQLCLEPHFPYPSRSIQPAVPYLNRAPSPDHDTEPVPKNALNQLLPAICP